MYTYVFIYISHGWKHLRTLLCHSVPGSWLKPLVVGTKMFSEKPQKCDGKPPTVAIDMTRLPATSEWVHTVVWIKNATWKHSYKIYTVYLSHISCKISIQVQWVFWCLLFFLVLWFLSFVFCKMSFFCHSFVICVLLVARIDATSTTSRRPLQAALRARWDHQLQAADASEGRQGQGAVAGLHLDVATSRPR